VCDTSWAEPGIVVVGISDRMAVAMPAQMLAYFSHSYRAEDREVNSFFWDLFSEAGYFFTVDPESNVFSIPYLESMMMRSNCSSR
jgi:hypothetical protein